MIKELISKMTLEEKVGQMTQVTLEAVGKKTKMKYEDPIKIDMEKLRNALLNHHIGSILNVYYLANSIDEWYEVITQIQDVATKETRLGIPVLYGIDAIHGANYTREATLFPQSIAMAAARNRELVRRSAEITAYEVRACGIPWNFNPVLDVGRHPLWPRLWETFGEDTYMVSTMGESYIKGLEGKRNTVGSRENVAGCMKHYLGYSFPLSGQDRTPSWIPERMMRDIFLPPFKAAAAAGVQTVMMNSSEINGIPVHSDEYLLKKVLRDELGFEGLAVSDWEDISRLHERDKVASSPKEAVKMAVMAGMDMSMVPFDFSFHQYLVELVKEGEVPESRIDEAVERILTLKFKTGLFENPYPDTSMKVNVGSQEFAEVSRQAAREAMTLLKNDDNILPLKKDAKVLVTGPTANLRSVLQGGWSYFWQGDVEETFPEWQETILDSLKAKIGDDNISFVEGTAFEAEIDIGAAVAAAKDSDVAIVCIGENCYAETPGNLFDLALPAAQLNLASAIEASGTPVILVLVEGRPRIITSIADGAAAILMAYLPGPYGAPAIADVLFGDFNPGGKLPITYPSHPNALSCYDRKPIEINLPNKVSELYSFGHGLSYTTFAYSDLTLSKKEIHEGETLSVSVTVKNSGDMAGRETVELYLRDTYRSVSPPIRQLKCFEGVNLAPGESETLTFELNLTDLSFHNRQNDFVAEAGEFVVMIDSLSAAFELVS